MEDTLLTPRQEEMLRKAREAMLREQIEDRGIHNPRLIEAMYRVPRHRFLPAELRERAYADMPLPIGLGQTISQPYIVAAMTHLMELTGSERILEIGTGSGYQAAILSRLAKEVHTIERHPQLAAHARALLEELGYDNVTVHEGDGSVGWAGAAPYDGILVTAAAPRPPQPLFEQLAEGGYLIIPVGAHGEQELQRWKKSGGGISQEKLFPVAFVPMRGELGWNETDWSEDLNK